MSAYLESMLSLIFPKNCENCRKPLVIREQLLCTSCLMDLPKQQCYRGKRNSFAINMCTFADLKEAFAFLRFEKNGMAQVLLHRLKYKNVKTIGLVLGEWFGEELKRTGMAHYDCLVPVPLHKKKLRIRGFNQSEVIAMGMSKALDIPVENVLIRKRHLNTQTMKRRVDRWLDMQNLYEYDSRKNVTDKNVLLVDDIITTGATVTESAKLIMDNGAKCISVACLASGK